MDDEVKDENVKPKFSKSSQESTKHEQETVKPKPAGFSEGGTTENVKKALAGTVEAGKNLIISWVPLVKGVANGAKKLYKEYKDKQKAKKIERSKKQESEKKAEEKKDDKPQDPSIKP